MQSRAARSARGVQPRHRALAGVQRLDRQRPERKESVHKVGERLLVFLSVSPARSLKWHPVQASPQGVLTIAPLTMMVSQKVTATNFKARNTGVVHLSSERMACSPPAKSEVACGAMVSWKTTVLVRAAPQPRY